MNKLIKDVNKKNHDDINVSVSYGIAFSDEYCDMNEGYSMTTNLYKLADSRMYEMKQNIKKELAKKKEK
jgi:GGDEF domain-containing protein